MIADKTYPNCCAGEVQKATFNNCFICSNDCDDRIHEPPKELLCSHLCHNCTEGKKGMCTDKGYQPFVVHNKKTARLKERWGVK